LIEIQNKKAGRGGGGRKMCPRKGRRSGVCKVGREREGKGDILLRGKGKW
jgi:hypothetical protein